MPDDAILMSTSEIAEMLGVSQNTVWYWLHKSAKPNGSVMWGTHPFPDATRVIGLVKLWRKSDVTRWARTTKRLDGPNRGGNPAFPGSDTHGVVPAS